MRSAALISLGGLELLLRILCVTVVLPSSAVANEALDITAKNGETTEVALGERIEQVVAKYRLQRWLYTKRIVIDKTAWPPHSHPVLTLGVTKRFLSDDMELVAVLLHEQFHWHMALHSRLSTGQLLPWLKRFLPALRPEVPYGSGDESSTYAHVPVCYMEYKALSIVFGREAARSYLSKQPFYADVYAAVLDEANVDAIEAALAKAGVRY